MIYGIWRTSITQIREDEIKTDKGFENWYYGVAFKRQSAPPQPWTFEDINAAYSQVMIASFHFPTIQYQVKEYSS